MTNFFLFPTTKKVRGPEAEKSANRTGSGRGKGPKSKSDCPDLRGLIPTLFLNIDIIESQISNHLLWIVSIITLFLIPSETCN